MARKTLVIGSCAWLEENRHLPGVQGVYAAQIQRCDAAKAERERQAAQRKAERERQKLDDTTAPATGASRPPFRP